MNNLLEPKPFFGRNSIIICSIISVLIFVVVFYFTNENSTDCSKIFPQELATSCQSFKETAKTIISFGYAIPFVLLSLIIIDRLTYRKSGKERNEV